MKLAQKNATRNSKIFPALQRKKQPNCAGKPPNWQHWCQPTKSTFKHKLRIHSITPCDITIQIVTHRVD